MRKQSEHKRLEIQYIPIKNIKPYWRNPRKNDKAVDPVVQSTDDYDFNVPLVLDRDNVIITGHTRYRALVKMGWAEAPCVIRDLPPDKAKEYRLVDNAAGEIAEWNMDFLIPELREMDPGEMQVFFPDLDLSKMLQATGGVGFHLPTAGEIERAGDRLGSAMHDLATRNAENLVEVTCPHCATSFGVDRTALEREATLDAKARPV